MESRCANRHARITSSLSFDCSNTLSFGESAMYWRQKSTRRDLSYRKSIVDCRTRTERRELWLMSQAQGQNRTGYDAFPLNLPVLMLADYVLGKPMELSCGFIRQDTPRAVLPTCTSTTPHCTFRWPLSVEDAFLPLKVC